MSTSSGFLKFNSRPTQLYVTADEDEFDTLFLSYLQEEGFKATYLPYRGGGRAYFNELKHLADDLEIGESYGIIAFASAATDCLEFHIKPQPKLAALIAYYPTEIPKPNTKYPVHLKVLCHIAGSQCFAPAFPSYTYQGTLPGFAEFDLEEYDKIAASLSWTRSLTTIRKAFQVELDKGLQSAKDAHVSQICSRHDLAGALGTMALDCFVNNVPTMTGGVGKEQLLKFYKDYFISKGPPSLTVKLISRTLGVDRVVDEMIVSFKHTHDIPWILPSVAPTGKQVHIAMVSVVSVRGGKLVSESTYWDQASVLVQVGLLNPSLVPENFKKQGLKRLPVYEAETAAKVLDEDSHPSNGLLADWGKPRAENGLPARPKQAADGGHAKGS
ncbi:related to dienelactone hydrolase and related enzymes [Ramularia collo-cygni]|uniref:Related to dienelactone hydrolase and related enzymes n=1 Tax=Ramularia collo-cygni TaxID=112498 RepID=A0A2D3UQ47_9PEZI|nr:related to dienelactone hydrolase and related enzymes [Ramularia collo-cygni]CZT14190.1 related to dienelactone hydrolase and related enzymes [Ramularia collo-cygni]